MIGCFKLCGCAAAQAAYRKDVPAVVGLLEQRGRAIELGVARL